MIDLYRMFDRRGALLYVGISNNAATRAMQHADHQPWWPEVATITVEHLECSRPTALTIERRTIREERPRYNIVHNRATGDEYDPTVQVRPFAVEPDLARRPQFRRLAYAVNSYAWHMQEMGVDRAAAVAIVDHLYRCAEIARVVHDACRTEMYPSGVQLTTTPDGEPVAVILMNCPTCKTYIPHPAPRKD